MALINWDLESPKLYPVESKNIIDVTGAGDTVIATLVAYYLDSMNMDLAIKMANIAAGLSVSNFGTTSVTKDQIELSKRNSRDGLVVFTNGCFDLLHEGHLSLLKYCRTLGEKLVVGINSDSSVKKLKGNERPVNDQNFRKNLLESLSFVDEVYIFCEDTPYDLIKKLKPD